METALRVISTSRPRAGRRFEPVAELALGDDAVNAARSLPGARRGLLLLPEMAGPFGVPDFVAVVGSPAGLTERLASGVPPLLNEVDAGIVAASAVSARRTVQDLAARLDWPVEAIERRITDLIRRGALIEDGAGEFRREASMQPVGRVYAIETKVKDWRRALRQARTYGLWCDSYVIVMGPLGPRALDQLYAAVAADRGGLVVGGRTMLRPRLGSRSPAQRMWGSEHVVAAASDS